MVNNWKQNKDIADNTVALIPMAAKPFHKGHYNLIKTAYKTNKKIILFISSSDRVRKNEIPIYAKTMHKIWNETIKYLLPDNVELNFVKNPITSIFELFDNLIKNEQFGYSYTIYGDNDDIQKRFNTETLNTYAFLLRKYNKLHTHCVSRFETENISGTKMRAWIEENDYNRFCIGLPIKWTNDVTFKMWNMLRNDVLKSNFIKKDIEINDTFKKSLIDLYKIMPDIDDWIKIKWYLVKMIPQDDRALLSKRHPRTKQQHPNDYEYKLMKIWCELSGKPLTYYIEDEEFEITP